MNEDTIKQKEMNLKPRGSYALGIIFRSVNGLDTTRPGSYLFSVTLNPKGIQLQ